MAIVATTIGANAGVLLYSVLVCLLIVCGAITALKGRGGWFIVGLLTFGLLWVIGAQKPAMPGSVWRKVASRKLRAPNAGHVD